MRPEVIDWSPMSFQKHGPGLRQAAGDDDDDDDEGVGTRMELARQTVCPRVGCRRRERGKGVRAWRRLVTARQAVSLLHLSP